MSCLENSTYTQNDESDQGWFVCESEPRMFKEIKTEADAHNADNLRYSFDYCVFAYPNGTGSGSNPCETSTACGKLQGALTYDSLSTANSDLDEFGYCDADGGSVTGTSYQSCLNCISASGDTNFIANCMYPTQMSHTIHADLY